MKIGTFTKQDDGSYRGPVATLTFRAQLTIWPIEAASQNAPNYRLTIDRTGAEAGVGWDRTADSGQPYVSVKLDDPRFDRPIWAALFEGEKGCALSWTRVRRKDEDETAAAA